MIDLIKKLCIKLQTRLLLLFDIVSRALEGNSSVGRKVEAFCIASATICGI